MFRIILIFGVLSSLFLISTSGSKAGGMMGPPPSNTPVACCLGPDTCVDTTFGVCSGIGFPALETSCEQISCSPVPPSQGDCCEFHVGTGCNVPSCEETVCNEDPFCCGDDDGFWDGLCVEEAEELCGTLCEDSGGPVVIVPTMGQWGMIFASIILGFIGIFALARERKINQYFD